MQARDWFGRTALKIAEKNGHADVVKLLEAAALATLFAAGGCAPNAAAIAEIGGEALEGIARGETTVLKAALQKAGASAGLKG